MPISKLFFALTALFLFSCTDGTDVKSSSSNQNDAPKVEKSNSKSCLEKYAMQPSTILDLKTVASLANIEPSALELIPEDEKSSLKVCKYTWNTGRKTTAKVGSRTMELNASNDILIGLFKMLDEEKSRIKPPYADWFKNSHRQMTAEEAATLKESASKKLEEEGVDVEVGMLLLDGIVDIGKKDVYIDVDGLGDLASARITGMSPDIYLDILHENLTFRVVVNVSNNRNENFELAKTLGAEIISLCD